MTSGRTAVKHFFPCRCPVPCPALAVLHAQSIIRYFVVLRSRTSSLACATHMYTPLSVARPRQSPSVCPCARHGGPRVLLQLDGAVLVLVPVCLPCAFSGRALWVIRVACLCHGAGSGG